MASRESRAIVTFSESGGFFSCRPNGHNTFCTYDKFPKGFSDVVEGADGHTYFWASVGPAGQYYVSWKRKDGKQFHRLGDKSGDYAGLYDNLNNVCKGDYSKIKVIFGPEKGTWVMITGKGGWRGSHLQRAPGLQRDIDRSCGKGVRHVALGKGGAWVVAYRDGSVNCDLKGHYGTLQRVLEDMSNGDLRGVFLDPFSPSHYVLGYKNGKSSTVLPHNWSLHVQF